MATSNPKVFNREVSCLGLIVRDQLAVTAASGAATKHGTHIVVTSESLTTAAGATYTLTLTNKEVAATSLVLANVCLGTATTGMPVITTITPAAGSVVIIVQNIHASAALNGTIKIRLTVVNK